MENKYQMFLNKQYDYEIGTLVMSCLNGRVPVMGVILGYDKDNDPLIFFFDRKDVLPFYRHHMEPLSEKHQK